MDLRQRPKKPYMRTDTQLLPKRIPFKYWDVRDEILMPINKTIYMVDRSEWEPEKYPKYRLRTKLPLEYVILRFTGTDPCTDYESCKERVRQIQKSQIDTYGHADIMWNFLIGYEEYVFEGTGWKHTTNKEEEHFWDIDFKNLDIAYIGRSMKDVTDEMRWAARKLIQVSMANDKLVTNFELLGDEEAIKTIGNY